MIIVWFWYWYCHCEISRSCPLSIAFFRCRHRKVDEMWFDLILVLYRWLLTRSTEWAQNKRLAASISWGLDVHPGVVATQLTISKFLWNPPSSCAARQPPAFEQLEYCWPWLWYPLSTLYFLNSWGSQQSKKRIITGAGLVRPGKNYHAVRKVEFNRRTSENPYEISPVEAPLKSAVWRSKFVIFHTCTTFFFEIFWLRSVGLAVLVHFHNVW